MAWMNDDGLYIKYGTEKATAETAGVYRDNHGNVEVELILDLTSLGSSSSIVSDTFFFPTGMFIEEVEVYTDVAATSGGSATLDIGLIQTDRSTAIDANGLIAALPLASINAAGDKVTENKGGTYAGALIGTATSNVGYLVANYNTAAFTAGTVRVRIRYHGHGTISH